jgi:hypothetical protein
MIHQTENDKEQTDGKMRKKQNSYKKKNTKSNNTITFNDETKTKKREK